MTGSRTRVDFAGLQPTNSTRDAFTGRAIIRRVSQADGPLPVAAFFVAAGALHFIAPRPYEAIMPAALPAHRALVYASGAAEIAGGLAALHPRTRAAAGWWLAATLVAVFPANVNMAVHAERFAAVPASVLWARLPLQALLVGWVLRATSPLRGLPRRARRRGRRR